MKYNRFEELPCWQDARVLTKMVFDLVSQNPFAKDYSLKDQIWRAAGSVMDNIAEGFDDGSTGELVRFLGYAQRSTSEIQSQLYRALDCGISVGSNLIPFMKPPPYAGNRSKALENICDHTDLKKKVVINVVAKER